MAKSRTAIIWKGAHHRAKPTEIWDSGVVVQHICSTFDTCGTCLSHSLLLQFFTPSTFITLFSRTFYECSL